MSSTYKNLIRIPSYVDSTTNERKIGEFIYAYLQKNTSLKITKQLIEDGRFNVIAADGYEPKLLFCCHIDTVEPKEGCKYSQFRGIVRKGRLYGLGAYDMKGGTAAVIEAAQSVLKTRGLTLLFYCDEEYRFAGMEKFIKKYRGKKPELAVFPEPTDLTIVNGCRGLIEIKFRVSGKSGHAAQPQSGINAIEALQYALREIRKNTDRYKNSEMGISTYNLACIKGGMKRGEIKTGELIVGDAANNIADIAEATMSVRPISREFNAAKVIEVFCNATSKTKAKVERIEILNDYAPFLIPREKLGVFEDAVSNVLGNAQYGDIAKSGYFDAQLLNQKLGIKTVIFGPKGENAHAANEWVSIKSLQEVQDVYVNLIKKICV